MNKIVRYIHLLPLKNKLIIAFIGFIIIPVSLLGLIHIQITSHEIRNITIKSAIQSNEQILKNLNSFLVTMIKLTEYPVSDPEMNRIMSKEYATLDYPDYEEVQDVKTGNNFAYNKIMTFSTDIKSVVLYDTKSNRIYGRAPTDYINFDYLEDRFLKEPWFDRILGLEGAPAVIGIHKDNMLTPNGDYVISVARSIVEPHTKKSLGIVMINIDIKSLERLWLDTALTKNSGFYLVDEHDQIIFSKDSDEINTSFQQIISKKEYLYQPHSILRQGNEKIYVISSLLEDFEWKVVTLIPQKELFSFMDIMIQIILLSIFIGIVISIVVAIFIATSITKPLYQLNEKMEKVAQGELDIAIDIHGGEIGYIGETVQNMLNKINELIARIYQEEKEKRNAEMLALQAQIQPHFIYNTINTIKWMAHIQNVPGIENALTSFSSLLSFAAKTSGDFVSVGEEIQFIKDYLDILKLRYYNKFTVQYDIDDDVYQYKTLKFLLQPVIENAIFHGFEDVKWRGELGISIYLERDRLIYRVQDNGKGMSKDTIHRIFREDNQNKGKKLNPIGLLNVQQRIKLHFGESYGLTIESTIGEGTLATICIPIIKGQEGEL